MSLALDVRATRAPMPEDGLPFAGSRPAARARVVTDAIAHPGLRDGDRFGNETHRRDRATPESMSTAA